MSSAVSATRQHLIRGALGSGLFGVIQRVLGLITAVLLARVLGAEGYGIYAFAISMAGFLAVPAQLGLSQLTVREYASNLALGKWALIRGLTIRVAQIASASVVAAVVFGALILYAAKDLPTVDPQVLSWALLLIPLLVAVEILSGQLRGLRHVIGSLWPGNVLKPGIITLALAVVFVVGLEFHPLDAVIVTVSATAVALIVLATLLFGHWPNEIRSATAEYESRAWLRAILPFAILSAANIITQKTDILMLGFFTNPVDVGVYQVVVQGAMLVSFGFVAVNSVLGPNIARLHAKNDRLRLQRLLSVTSSLVFALALAVMALIFFFGEAMLRVIFGDEFERGYPALVILGFGQLINASVGSVGTFLSMTGHEGDTLRAIAAAAVLNVILNWLLIPPLGLLGASIATMVATILWNIMMSVSLYRRLGLVPGPTFRLTRKHS